jgi:HD-like signal output (HDOD) protein
VSKIVSYIEKDPGYVAKMLGIVNSCLYGVSIGSVKQAVVYLGLDTVKNIILSSEIFDVFRATSINRDEIESIWRHSSLMSILFHKIYQKATGKQIPEEYATTGPLHDIGMLLMLQYFPVEYKMIQEKSKKEPNRVITEIEQEVIGVPHTVMGGYLLDFWNLPYYLVEGCLYHHAPLSPTVHEKQIMAITSIADTISWNSVRHKDYSSGIDPILFEIAGISADALFEDLKDMFTAPLQ